MPYVFSQSSELPPTTPFQEPQHPRARRLFAAAWALLALALIIIVWTSLSNFGAIGTVVSAAHNSDDAGEVYRTFFAGGYEDAKPGSFYGLWLALLALGAWIKLASLVARPAAWDSLRNITIMILCIAAVAGYPLAAAVYGLVGLMPQTFLVGVLCFLLAPLVLPMAGIGTVVGIAASVSLLTGGIVFLLIGLPLEIVDYLNERGALADIRRQKQQWLIEYVRRFRLWLFGLPVPDMPPDESKGARIATPHEIAAAYSDMPESMGFSHVDHQPYSIKTDKHVLIMASTRSGKGVTIIIPHLLRYAGSAFVLDPKGENAKATGRQRAALNDAVHYLDPFGISGKPQSRFNPLARFTPDNMEAESKALAAAFFIVSDRERDHWSTAAQQLLASIILYVSVAPDIPRGKKDLPTVRRLLLGLLKETLDKMVKIDDADGLLRDLALSFIKTPEKEFGSIVSHAQRQTEILDNPYMIACLSATGSGTEVDFKAWHSGTMTVFLCLSAPKFPTFNRWLRLVLTSALDEMTDTLNPPQLPVCFMLDELATLGNLATVENAVGLAAGYGIQLVNVFQDIAQMRDLYKTRWASFIGNSGVRALFNLDDFDTASYWSKFIGGTIAESHSRQENMYGQSSGQNVGETLRPLFSPDRIMMDFSANKMLVLAQGVRPIITDRIAYFDDPTLIDTWDDPRRIKVL